MVLFFQKSDRHYKFLAELMRSPYITQYKKAIMRSSITLNSQKHLGERESLLHSGDKVYLYGDTTYTGRLIHPIERTYPAKWTVQIDRGGYEAVNVKNICVLEVDRENTNSQSDVEQLNLDIPFSSATDESESTLELLEEIAALKRENALLRQQNKELEQENQLLKKDLEQAKQIIRRAKDISPVMRLSLKRVVRLAHHACMDVKRTVGGWILKMGDKARKFRRLVDIWDLISVDEFILSEIFPPDKLIAVELIRPPKRRIRSQLHRTTIDEPRRYEKNYARSTVWLNSNYGNVEGKRSLYF